MSLKETMARIATHSKAAERVDEPKPEPVLYTEFKGPRGWERHVVVDMRPAILGSPPSKDPPPIDEKVLESAVKTAASEGMPVFSDWRQDPKVVAARAAVDELMAVREHASTTLQRQITEERTAQQRLDVLNGSQAPDVDRLVRAQADLDEATKARQATFDGLKKINAQLAKANAALKAVEESARAATRAELERAIADSLGELAGDFHRFDLAYARYRVILARVDDLGLTDDVKPRNHWKLPEAMRMVRHWLAELRRDGVLP